MLEAVQHIKQLRGGSQAQLMVASDGYLYVVKFQNNPQHTRVLANEYLASRLARQLGLPVPDVEIIYVDEKLIAAQNISIETNRGPIAVCSGTALASRFVDAYFVSEYLPNFQVKNVANVYDFMGMLAFDKWTSNADGRQAIFHKDRGQALFSATFIDFGYFRWIHNFGRKS